MKRVLLLLMVAVAVTVTANAQEHPRYEIYGTYSLMVADIDPLDDETIHGFGAGFQGNLNKYLGVVGEFTFNWGRSQPTPVPPAVPLGADTRVYTILFGPRVSYRTRPVTIFGHYLVGPANSKVDQDAGPDLSFSNTEIAMAVGGGVDINVSKRIAIRGGQFDYLSVHSDLPLNNGGSSWFRNFRYQAGVVFKF
jgi:opacity protein-like surface antigen